MKRKLAGRSPRVTVRDIAERSGLSIAAVSSVLNNRHVERRIALETVEKIRAVATELGYLPNIGARGLRRGTASTQNIVLAFVTSYEAPLTNHLLLCLRQLVDSRPKSDRTFSIIMEWYSAGRLREMPGLLNGEHFNAAIITNTTPEDDKFLARSHLPFPVVLVNRSIPRYSCVTEDPNAGGRAAEVLLKAKCRRCAVLRGTPVTQSTQGRADRFIHAVQGRIGQAPHEIISDGLSESAAYRAMHTFLRRGVEIDGLYVVSDGMALGAYHALKEHGLSIPDDVAVVGVGDRELSSYLAPPLSTVGVQRDELGKEAARLLLRLIENPGCEHLIVEVPVELVLRTSTQRR